MLRHDVIDDQVQVFYHAVVLARDDDRDVGKHAQRAPGPAQKGDHAAAGLAGGVGGSDDVR